MRLPGRRAEAGGRDCLLHQAVCHFFRGICFILAEGTVLVADSRDVVQGLRQWQDDWYLEESRRFRVDDLGAVRGEEHRDLCLGL